jgi:hypothetical protein
MKNNTTRNIFDGDFTLPEKVCILAPGPNGKSAWEHIDCPVIAINYAVYIDLPNPQPHRPGMWLQADWWGIKTDWFAKADKEYTGVRIFSDSMISKRPSDAIPADWSFRFTPGTECVLPLGSGQYMYHPRELRPDGTSSCIGMELAARFGAKEIAVCGVDFRGERYYNGRTGCFQKYDRKGVWAYLPFANSLIKWIKSQGVDIYSLSETALDLEVRNGK